jgi:hypothetical protein
LLCSPGSLSSAFLAKYKKLNTLFMRQSELPLRVESGRYFTLLCLMAYEKNPREAGRDSQAMTPITLFAEEIPVRQATWTHASGVDESDW